MGRGGGARYSRTNGQRFGLTNRGYWYANVPQIWGYYFKNGAGTGLRAVVPQEGLLQLIGDTYGGSRACHPPISPDKGAGAFPARVFFAGGFAPTTGRTEFDYRHRGRENSPACLTGRGREPASPDSQKKKKDTPASSPSLKIRGALNPQEAGKNSV